jgi:hypothetical protein
MKRDVVNRRRGAALPRLQNGNREVLGSYTELARPSASFDDGDRVHDSVCGEVPPAAQDVEIETRWRHTGIMRELVDVHPATQGLGVSGGDVGQASASECEEQKVVCPCAQVDRTPIADELEPHVFLVSAHRKRQR